MLKFWKKSVLGQKEGNRSNSSSPTNTNTPPNSPTSTGCINKSNCNSFDSYRSTPLISLDDEGLYDISETPKERSRLSKTLHEILADKAGLNYFMQYLKSRNASSYIHCWLDIDNYQQTIQEINEQKLENSHISSSLPSGKIEHDSLSVSTDCDSYTADSSSLYDYVENKLNIDGKCERTNKVDCNSVCDKDSGDTSPNDCADEAKCTQIIDCALKIFKKYIALEAIESIKCPEIIRKDIIENICSTEKILSANCFDKVQAFLFDIMEKEYFQAFLGSDYFCKHQIDVLTSGNVVLDDILYNETALFYFMEYLEQENNRNLLEFWLAATNFQQQLRDQGEFFDPIEGQNDAVVLYDKYFSLQAHCPLGFSDKVRFAVEQSICGENGLILDCFHLPLKIIEQVLEKNYLKLFLASQLFYKYLSELINTVQTNGYANGFERSKQSPSDCSSEKSFSTNSTFLAMENPNQKPKKNKTSDMTIDTRQLYDPDSLWKRKKNHRLSFGRVTELGRFETDFEPEPDKNTKSKLKSVMKKFVNLEEDKNKEEMAWQVAEMIVKDITNITLQEQKPYQS